MVLLSMRDTGVSWNGINVVAHLFVAVVLRGWPFVVLKVVTSV